MKETEYKFNNVTMRIHEPERTEEEEKKWREHLEKACIRFMSNVQKDRGRK